MIKLQKNFTQRDMVTRLRASLDDVEKQIQALKLVADDMEIPIYHLRNHQGDFPYAPLLVTKSNLLLALARFPFSEEGPIITNH